MYVKNHSTLALCRI